MIGKVGRGVERTSKPPGRRSWEGGGENLETTRQAVLDPMERGAAEAVVAVHHGSRIDERLYLRAPRAISQKLSASLHASATASLRGLCLSEQPTL